MSWEEVSSWYDALVGEKGHYYHQHVIFPQLLKLLDFKNKKVLDLCCGQGAFSRALPSPTSFVGLDISPSLITAAKKMNKIPSHQFAVQDISIPFSLEKKDFDYATILLALQGIENPKSVLQNANTHLRKDGKIVCVINHPCFRIPRQSEWGVDEKRNLQYRALYRYATFMKVPITTSYEDQEKEVLAFHYSLSMLTKAFYESGFLIESLEEWISDKVSSGAQSKRENFARKEFPLFMAIVGIKK
ncbi:MAG: class I SAM-dependent methyltransferase [Chlamydiota bacterium]